MKKILLDSHRNSLAYAIIDLKIKDIKCIISRLFEEKCLLKSMRSFISRGKCITVIIERRDEI